MENHPRQRWTNEEYKKAIYIYEGRLGKEEGEKGGLLQAR